jgi:hypothetical protein
MFSVFPDLRDIRTAADRQLRVAPRRPRPHRGMRGGRGAAQHTDAMRGAAVPGTARLGYSAAHPGGGSAWWPPRYGPPRRRLLRGHKQVLLVGQVARPVRGGQVSGAVLPHLHARLTVLYTEQNICRMMYKLTSPEASA